MSRITKIITALSVLLLIGGIFTMAHMARAESSFNRQINYQGKLTNSSGVAVADGLYSMKFRLYTTATSATTTNIWEEIDQGNDKIQVTGGLFSVLLGSTTPLTNISFNQTLYLGVEIGGTGSPVYDGEMTPRKKLGAVPAAFEAERFGGLATTSFLRSDAVNSTTTASNWLTFTNNGAGNIAVFTGGGNVGVGTTSPYAKLSVAGSIVGQDYDATTTVGYKQYGTTLLTASTTNFGTFLGFGAGTSTTATGLRNTFLGYQSGQANTGGDDNTAVGYQALYQDAGANGSNNTAVGSLALFANTSGSENSAFGKSALVSNTTGAQNNAFGYFALRNNTTSLSNNAFGYSALTTNTTGAKNSAFGDSALVSNGAGSNNTAMGYFALQNNLSGNFNSALGYQAGTNVTTGYDNIFLGHDANIGGTAITTGFNNIGMGYNIKFPSAATNNMLNIGNFLFANLPATTTNTSLTTQPLTGQLGVGTSSPYAKLTVWGADALSTTAAFEVANTASTTLAKIWNNGTAYFLGNVGVGTTSPYAKLSVVGSIVGADYDATTTVGYKQGGRVLLTGDYSLKDTFLGFGAGTTTVAQGGADNTFLGYWAGQANEWATKNTAIGSEALRSNTAGEQNVAIGYQALATMTVGQNNTAIGHQALLSNTTGSSNTANGYQALLSNTIGHSNTANGFGTLSSNTTGHSNTANGYQSLFSNTTGSFNSALGYQAGYSIGTGYDNIFLGHDANVGGTAITTGFNNIGMGYNIKFPTAATNNMLNIGNFLFANLPATTTNTSLTTQPLTGQLGVGTSSPYAKLTVWGADALSTTAAFEVANSASTTLAKIWNNGTAYFLGNVGVGTTSPYAKLSVAGSIVGQDYDATTTVGYKQYGTTLLTASTTNFGTFLGFGAGTSTTATGLRNTFLGYQSGQANTTGDDNTAVGYQALYNNTGLGGNNAIGSNALYSNTTGSENTAIGDAALNLNNGDYNTANGSQALISNITGSYNTANGAYSLYSNSAGSFNTAIGNNALRNTTGNFNTALGYTAGYNITTGYDNIFLGHDANVGGTAITTGFNNIGMGYNIKFPTAATNNMLNIGNFLFANLPATTTNTSLTTQPLTGRLGVGTSSPYAKLTVWGADALSTTAAFEVANSASTTLAKVWNNGTAYFLGNVGVGTTSPGSLLSLNSLANFTTATSSFYSTGGINLAAGCFAVNGVCVSGGGSGATTYLALTDTPSSFTASAIPYTNTGATALLHNANFVFDGNNLGVGTTSPYAKLSVVGETVAAYFTGTTTATSTFAGGVHARELNITGNTSANSWIYWNGTPFIAATTTNTFLGLNAGTSTLSTGVSNTFLGYESGQANTTGDVNVAVGHRALFQNTTASYNTAIGSSALYSNTTGGNNTANGYQALTANTTGGNNTANGYQALTANTTGSDNTANGYRALFSNTTGIRNTANGYGALTFNTTGLYNTAIGFQAGTNITTGYDNIFLGHDANVGGTAITTGFNNIGMGYNIKFPAVSSSNMLNIGNFLFANLPATTTNTSLTTQPLTGQLGVGTSSPYAKLTVWGADALSTTAAFEVANTASTTLAKIWNNGTAYFLGNVGVGTTSPYAKLSVVGETVAQNFTATSSNATSTFSGGVVIANGSFYHDVGGGFTSVDDLRMGATHFEDNAGMVSWMNMQVTSAIPSGTVESYTAYLDDNELLTIYGEANGSGAVTNYGVGIGSSTPYAKLSVSGTSGSFRPIFTVASSTAAPLFTVNYNGVIGIGTSTAPSLAKFIVDGSMSQSGATNAIAGMHEMYTFNPSTANTTQVGDRLVLLNQPTSNATNTAVGQIIRGIDSSGISNKFIGLEVVANGGTNTYGVNTGIRATGATFGLQGLTNGLAGGTSTPAAIYGENTGTTQGDILRLYTSSMTTATSVAQFFQEGSAFSGSGLLMNFGKGGGTFTGNFLKLQINDSDRFLVTSSGTTTIGRVNSTAEAAGLQIGYGGLCVDNDGSCVASTTGRISAVSYTTGSTDLAENYYSIDSLETGDIVAMAGKYSVKKAVSSTEPIIGVVSTKPGITLGEGEASFSPFPSYPIGLAGRIPVKVSTENGPIAVGDSIVLSSVEGVGMKDNGQGVIVGRALEAFDGAEYYSEATIDTETRKTTTGKQCTTKRISYDHKNSGGSGSEDTESPYKKSVKDLPQYEEVCTDIKTDVSPTNKSAENGVTSKSQAVKIGKALMFIHLENRLTASNGNMESKADFSGFGLDSEGALHAKKLLSLSGDWSIDENGNLTVKEVHTQKLCIGETCIDEAELKDILGQKNHSMPSSQPSTAGTAETTAATQTDQIPEASPPTSSAETSPESPPTENGANNGADGVDGVIEPVPE